jgi:hypothetical protein
MDERALWLPADVLPEQRGRKDSWYDCGIVFVGKPRADQRAEDLIALRDL